MTKEQEIENKYVNKYHQMQKARLRQVKKLTLGCTDGIFQSGNLTAPQSSGSLSIY